MYDMLQFAMWFGHESKLGAQFFNCLVWNISQNDQTALQIYIRQQVLYHTKTQSVLMKWTSHQCC